MRFAQLNLERYGRFENCILDFPSGEPDLHIVLGANEAGKTTTLAAISDLLFGFGTRSPYNFRFDYPLLRIGAVLEEDGQRFACRRRKAQSGSLVDADEQPLSEGPLLALLRGQTRETFHLGFSLDQTRLRQGGRAMVDARDDLGRAMFAAGSGMTGVSDVLNALKEEADAIWAPRASARRTYTIAERQFDEASRKVREAQLRPRAWTDARDARDQRQTELSQLEEQRGELTRERSRIDRLRRVGPHLRRRAELMAQLQSHADTVALTPQAEEIAERAFLEAEKAQREQAAAAALLQEATDRIAAIGTDPEALTEAETIDSLLEQRGAVQKARQDLARLEGELKASENRVKQLGEDLGGFAGEPPPRLTVSRLRALARRHAEEAVTHRTVSEALALAETSISAVVERLPEHDPIANVEAIAPAVEAARRLGGDIDDRCAALVLRAETAEGEAGVALAQLRPWSGTFDELASMPEVGEEEIASAQSDLARAAEAMREEAAETARLREELQRSELRRDSVARSGQAVSPDAVQEARQGRDRLWALVRGHLTGEEAIERPRETAEEFERSIGEADALADARFASAEGSAQLVALEAVLDDLRLQLEQAGQRRAQAEADRERAASGWRLRLSQAGLPDLEPEPFRAWLRSRAHALRLNGEAAGLRQQSTELLARREKALQALRAVAGVAAGESALIGPVLASAESALASHEAEARAVETDRQELRRLRQEAESASRKLDAATRESEKIVAEWETVRASAGVALPIEDAESGLGLFEELRVERENAATLERRARSIGDDETAFASAVAALSDRLGIATGDEPNLRLDALRRRLEEARALETARVELEAVRSRREEQVRSAKASYEAALDSVSELLSQCALPDLSGLPEAVERSRAVRRLKAEMEEAERLIAAGGDGYSLSDLESSWTASDPDELARRAQELDGEIGVLNDRITDTANALGDARRAFEALEQGSGAADAAADAAQARAEMEVLAEAYLLKRSEATILKWAIEKYRERRQDPLLRRASELFGRLTLGRYAELKVDHDSASPRLLGLCDDGATLVDVDAMSEGTTDQLFLALRLAAVEQSIAAGIRLPFLADDLFVNFDDERAAAGFEVLAELARSTQVLFFTHHAHLSAIAASVVGDRELAPCLLD